MPAAEIGIFIRGLSNRDIQYRQGPNIPFLDSTSSYLFTEIGTLAIDSLRTFNETAVAEPERAIYVGVGFSTDNAWIQYHGKNILWVPSEYRPSRSTVCGMRVGIGVGSGRVWLCCISAADACNYLYIAK